jgi:hypothetical protein
MNEIAICTKVLRALALSTRENARMIIVTRDARDRSTDHRLEHPAGSVTRPPRRRTALGGVSAPRVRT